MRKRGVSRRLIGLVLAGVLIVVGSSFRLLGPVAGLVSGVAHPFQTGLSQAGNATSEWFSVIGNAGKLGAKNQQLQAQVAALQQQLSQETETKAENTALRAQLGVGTIDPDRLVAAEVVAYQPDNFREFLTISRGSRDGIAPGMAVVKQGELVGTVQSVGPHTASVFLVIDPEFRVAALDQDQSDRPTGTIQGQIGNGLEMSQIAQNETIHPGDSIVTSGLGGSVEKGLIIGHVQAISKQDNGVFQTAQVTSDIQFSRLEIVYVVVRPQ